MKMVSIQFCITLICLFPLGFFYVASAFVPIKYSVQIEQCLTCVSDLHSILDSILMLYYVKPYNQFCAKLWQALGKMLLRRNTIEPVENLPIKVVATSMIIKYSKINVPAANGLSNHKI